MNFASSFHFFPFCPPPRGRTHKTMMMTCLPPREAITVGEVYGQMVHMTPESNSAMKDQFLKYGPLYYPIATSSSSDDVSDTKNIVGEEILLTKPHEENSSWLTQTLARIHQFLFIQDRELVNEFSCYAYQNLAKVLSCTSTSTNAIKIKPSLSWHPYRQLLAVVLDDASTIGFYDVHQGQWNGKKVQHPSLEEIFVLAWAPCSGGVLAIGCKNGLMLWNMNEPSGIVRFGVVVFVLSLCGDLPLF